MVTVEKGNKTYQLARYWVDVGGPRPGNSGDVTARGERWQAVSLESYREDYRLAQSLSRNQSDRWYRQIKSGAESGWDYSSRWFSGSQDGNELYSVSTGDILPVDLNSFLCKNAEIIAELYRRLERLDIAKQYEDIRENLKAAIRYGNKTEKSSSTRGFVDQTYF